jgi:hypothetical protein
MTTPIHHHAIAAGILAVACGCAPSGGRLDRDAAVSPAEAGPVAPNTASPRGHAPTPVARLERAEAFVGKHVLVAAGTARGG